MKAAVLWSLVVLLAFVCTEAAVFRYGWYNRYVEPQSTTGFVEYQLRWLRVAPASERPDVLVAGDSRIAEGFSAPQAGIQTANRLHFWNFGIPGSTPRVWYYFLRDASLGRRPLAAVVLALDQYSDVDMDDYQRDRISDLNYVIGRLRLSDCWDFATSITIPQDRRTALD